MNARTAEKIEFICQIVRFGLLLALGLLALNALFASVELPGSVEARTSDGQYILVGTKIGHDRSTR